MGNARRLRFWLAISILFLLWWFVLGVVEREAGRVENRAVDMVLGQLRSALVIRGAELMLDRQASLEDGEGINPFELIDHQWGSYAGECGSDSQERGNWCFRPGLQKDTEKQDRGRLIYNPKQPIVIDERRASAGEPLAWRVIAEFADRNQNGVREQTERLTGLKLEPEPWNREEAP